MSVGPVFGPSQRPSHDRDLAELFRRVEALERVTPPSAGGGLQWASEQSGGDTIPTQGVGSFTRLNLDNTALYTNDAGMYSIEAAVSDGKYGLAIHDTGTYLIHWSVAFEYSAPYDPSLLDIAVSAGFGGDFDILVPTVTGGNYARGDRASYQNTWRVTATDLIVITADNTVNPIVWAAQQDTAYNIDAYVYMYAVQITTETFGF